MQRRGPKIAGTYGSGPSSSDHLWRAGVPWKQPIPGESPAPAQSVLTKFKAPMQASDFDEALTSINPGLRRMIFSGGSRTSARGRVNAQAPRLSTRRRRLHVHTHIHSLCRRRQNVQVTCLAGLRAFTVRARVHWAFTQFGAGRVAGPKGCKPKDEDTDLATVQKGPSTLCICDVLADTHTWNHIAYLLNFTAYPTYCL